MAELTEKSSRKSVSFADNHEVVDANGDSVEKQTNGVDKSTAESHSADATSDPAVDDLADQFASLAKKKKPKKKAVADEEAVEEPAADGELDLSSLKKKKKKKSKAEDLEKELAGGEAEETSEERKDEEGTEMEGDPIDGTGIWQHDATSDIPYGQLLGRFFTMLEAKHPGLVDGAAKSYKIPPPQCLREGNKKTLLANLPDICKRLNRSEEHVTAFLFAELGTSGSVDASRRLIIRGRFQAKQIENVLRRYIMDYVICKTCKSPNTELSRGENRLNFITCNSCASRRSVQAIRSGFSAQIGKRKRMQG